MGMFIFQNLGQQRPSVKYIQTGQEMQKFIVLLAGELFLAGSQK
jgi:hypothetical protein